MEILLYSTEKKGWDEYVARAHHATLYHELGWKHIFEDFFGHKALYLMAKEGDNIKGILPLVSMKSRLFGKFIVSLPFHCIGGACADDPSAEHALIAEAINTTKKEKVDYLELRNSEKKEANFITQSHKAGFLLDLTPGLDDLWKGFKKQIRNRVRKAEMGNPVIKFGHEYLNDFYNCYSAHMKQLGLPMHDILFYKAVLNTFPEESRIAVVFHNGRPIGAKFFIMHKDTMYLIWGASAEEARELMPNYLLTWEVIKYALKAGYKYCDFGRSTVNTGPYYFKESWGGRLQPLYWQYYLNNGNKIPDLTSSGSKYKFATEVWKRLPAPVTNFIGPRIVKYIP